VVVVVVVDDAVDILHGMMTMTTQNRAIVEQGVDSLGKRGRQHRCLRLVAALVMGGCCSSGGSDMLLVAIGV
jgi:hypothetical protein